VRPDDIDSAVVASRSMLAVVARTVAHALEQVSLPQFRVLVVLVSAGPHRVGDLASRLGAVVSTFSRTVDRMESAGWVTRSASPDSRREVIVEVTPEGRALVEQVTEARRTELAGIMARIPAERRHAVAQAFEDFAVAAGEPALEDLLPLGV
jgi:DNA-binding MarR family transcriptional regulator